MLLSCERLPPCPSRRSLAPTPRCRPVPGAATRRPPAEPPLPGRPAGENPRQAPTGRARPRPPRVETSGENPQRSRTGEPRPPGTRGVAASHIYNCFCSIKRVAKANLSLTQRSNWARHIAFRAHSVSYTKNTCPRCARFVSILNQTPRKRAHDAPRQYPIFKFALRAGGIWDYPAARPAPV